MYEENRTDKRRLGMVGGNEKRDTDGPAKRYKTTAIVTRHPLE
jgi:hypothetical protein